MANLPKISIITVVFNGEKDIQQCILSVASQHYPNKEHLIVDGLSTDKTMEIVRKYADQYSHIRWISEKDNGIYDAMNKGIDLATGEWIYFLGSDDVLFNNDVLSGVFSKCDTENTEVIYGNVFWGDSETIYDGKFTRLKLMGKNICQQAIFYKKSIFSKIGKFDVKYKILADHVFNMKWFNDDNIKHEYLDNIIAIYGIKGESTTCVDLNFSEDLDTIIKEQFPAEYSENYLHIKEIRSRLAEQHTVLLEYNNVIEDYKRNVAHCQQQIVKLKLHINELENEINGLYSSASWRITAPLRNIHAAITGTRKKVEPSMPVCVPVSGSAASSTVYNIRGFIQQLTELKLKQFLSIPNASLIFPKKSAPLVSVILVLYNKSEYTYQCLETLLANVGVSYELIIIDNASADSTQDFLGRLGNVTTRSNVENVGFLKASNQASELAKGKWLLFLNNDTQVLPNLLAALVDTAERDDKCGAVGGKLIFPDGKLQEAGSIIWSDGSCLGYGRDDDPSKGEYSYLREVDYCSGACLLVRRDLFEQVGRFDERYVPAYYEEVDLCMTIRKAGYKVIYQPNAKVIHYEFGSAERSSWALELQKTNRDKFVTKWKDQLNNKYKNSADNILHARESSKFKANILVVDDRVPDPSLGCGYPRTYSLLHHLVELGCKVTFFPCLFPERPEPCTTSLQQLGIEVLYGNNYDNFIEFYTERQSCYDTVWVSRPHNMVHLIDNIRKINKNQHVIYDAEAVFAARDILKAKLNGTSYSSEEEKSLISSELSLVDRAEAVVAVSKQELELIHQGVSSSKPSAVLGHSVSIVPTTKAFDLRRDLLFVGSIVDSPSPNEDTIIYFVNEIFPLIRKHLDVKLWIVGTVLVDSVRNLNSEYVVVTGRVDDLRPYYDQSRLFVVPSRYAGGIPLKLVDAMAHGLPAVVSPLIATQMSVDERTVLIGDGPIEFAEQVVRLYKDENQWNILRAAGIELVQDEFAAETFKSRLDKLLRDSKVLKGDSLHA